MLSASSRLLTHALSTKCIASSTKRILTYIDPIMTSSTTRELFTYAHPGSCSERKFTHAVSVEGATSKSPPTTWKGHDTKDQHQGYEKTWTKGILTYPDPIMPSCSASRVLHALRNYSYHARVLLGASRRVSHPDRATKETIATLSFKGVTKDTKLQIKERMKSSNKRFSDLKLRVPHPSFSHPERSCIASDPASRVRKTKLQS